MQVNYHKEALTRGAVFIFQVPVQNELLEGKGVAKDQEIFWQRTEEMSSAGSCQVF